MSTQRREPEPRLIPAPTSRELALQTPRKDLLDEAALHGLIRSNLEQLASELAQGKSERLTQYLDFASRFHHYSRANQWLILSQMPTATRVASYRKWQDEGYQVARGQTGIRILAPSVRKQRNDVSGEEEEVVIRFVAVSVFDESQLTPEKRPPAFFTPLEGDNDHLYQHLVTAATVDGFEVSESEETQGAEGFSEGRRLVTRAGLASTNRVLTLVHEYAHGLLHQQLHALSERRPLSRNVKECHAEATAYVVGRHFGVPTPFSADYLLQWGGLPTSCATSLTASSRLPATSSPQSTPNSLSSRLRTNLLSPIADPARLPWSSHSIMSHPPPRAGHAGVDRAVVAAVAGRDLEETSDVRSPP